MAEIKRRGSWYGLTPEQRFEKKFIPEPNTGCFLWTGRPKRDGYGQFKFRNMMQQAHRVAWIFSGGEIPEGKSILHRCDNPACVNPVHLYVGDQFANMRDASERGRLN